MSEKAVYTRILKYKKFKYNKNSSKSICRENSFIGKNFTRHLRNGRKIYLKKLLSLFIIQRLLCDCAVPICLLQKYHRFIYLITLRRAIPSRLLLSITIAFSPLYDFCLVILILADLTPNNKIDPFLRLSFSRRLFRMFPPSLLSLSLSHCLLQMAVTVPLYGSARFPEISSTYYTTTHHLRHLLLPSHPPFLSRLLTAVCQSSTPPYFSRVLARTKRRRRRQEVAVEVDGIRAAAPTDAYESTYTGGFRRIGRYFEGSNRCRGVIGILERSRGGSFPFVGDPVEFLI